MTSYQYNTIRNWLVSLTTVGDMQACGWRSVERVTGYLGFRTAQERCEHKVEIIQQLLAGLHTEFLAKGGSMIDANRQLYEEDSLDEHSLYALRQSRWEDKSNPNSNDNTKQPIHEGIPL